MEKQSPTTAHLNKPNPNFSMEIMHAIYSSGNLHILKPHKTRNKASLKVKMNRTQIGGFNHNLFELLVDKCLERKEFHKNLITDFLKKTYYDPNHFINIKGRNDLVKSI